jgi:hypothetical protein
MQAFVDSCRQQASFERQGCLVSAIVKSPDTHARFLNTLARLEYVGVRKMLKARHSQDLDLEGLQHVLEEVVHSIRLKKFAHAVAPVGVCVASFSREHTLAGDAAEAYFQRVDRASAETLVHPNAESNYLLTSAAIEVRARVFYPAYQAALQAADLQVSVASIMNDEEQHLAQMQTGLQAAVPNWQNLLERVMRVEEQAFLALLDAFASALGENQQIRSHPAPSPA